jgi:hypothetical protein
MIAQPQNTNIDSARLIPVPPPVASQLSQVSPRVKTAKRIKFLRTVKRLAWRLTALYLWLRFAIDGLFGGAPLHSAEKIAVHRLTDYLSSVGFAPGNPDYMLPILRFGWVLAITGVNLWGFIGFWIYVLFFIPIALFFLVFQEQVNLEQAPNQEGLNKPQQRRLLLPSAIGLSLAWFLLYGTSTSTKPIAVGAFFAGIIFVSLAFRAFQRARPLTVKDIAFGSWVERLGVSAVQDKQRLQATTKSAASVNLKFERFHKFLLVGFVYCFRGRRGRDRIAMYILLEYVVFLILLAGSAVLFWGLAIRVTAPTLSVKQALVFSASHFLPGMAVQDVPTGLPLWTHLGPALTAWILFVLFVGPAASLLPARQGVYAGQIGDKCLVFRKLVMKIQERIRAISKLRDSLP